MRFEVVLASRQSEVFNAAIYRFLAERPASADDDVVDVVKVRSEPLGARIIKQVTFCSDAAAREFEAFWNAFPKTRRVDSSS